jgi:tryptophan synthase alpha chain
VNLEKHLRARRDAGAKLLVPYVTGGLGADWLELVQAVASAGADAVEIGIPFSDPVMDGPTVQEASQRALEGGATPAKVIADASQLDVEMPLAVMTYYNPVHHAGHQRFAASLADAGIDGAIVPDLPVDELDGWGEAADAAGVETVLLATPLTRDERLRTICERSRGFIYGVSLLGVTGERAQLAAQAEETGRRLKAATDRPVLLGVGISNAEQAVQAAAVSDGVVVGSAVVGRVLRGGGADEVHDFVRSLREALDA